MKVTAGHSGYQPGAETSASVRPSGGAADATAFRRPLRTLTVTGTTMQVEGPL